LDRSHERFEPCSRFVDPFRMERESNGKSLIAHASLRQSSLDPSKLALPRRYHKVGGKVDRCQFAAIFEKVLQKEHRIRYDGDHASWFTTVVKRESLLHYRTQCVFYLKETGHGCRSE